MKNSYLKKYSVEFFKQLMQSATSPTSFNITREIPGISSTQWQMWGLNVHSSVWRNNGSLW